MNPDPTLHARVHLERVRLFFGLAKGNMGGILVGTVLIGAVLLLGGASRPALATWVLLIGIGWVAVVLYERHVQHIGVTADTAPRLLRTRIALGAVVALLWGLSPFLLPDTGTRVQDTYIFIILSTLVTVGALGYAAMPAYYLILDLVSLGPLSAKFAYQLLAHGDRYYLLLLLMVLAWQAAVLTKARQVSRTVIDALVLNERLKDEVAQHMRTREALQRLAQQDPLTGLANRTLFADRLNQTLDQCQRTGSHCAQLYIDLDRFKPVNDRRGHAVGDRVLQQVAQRMVGCIREADTAARIGGDEFVVLLREVAGSEAALHVADKIRTALCNPFDIDGQAVEIGCSIGVGLFPIHGYDEITLSQAADSAMYRAKVAGGNRVQLADTPV